MALAWKAGWVHALTSSNLVSSATTIPALTRAGILFSGVDVALQHDSCPECAPSFRGMFSPSAEGALAGPPWIRVTWRHTAPPTQAQAPRTMRCAAPKRTISGLPTRCADCAHGPVVE